MFRIVHNVLNMAKFTDLTGKTFHSLTVLGLSQVETKRHIKWKCLCECGSETHVLGLHLKRGTTKSCGCLTGTPKNLRNKGFLTCFLCKETKEFNKFYRRGGKETGYRQPCKECSYWQTSARFYNLSIDELKELKQIKQCKICDSSLNLVVDHNHTTGIVRDVICHNCNMVIGFSKENIELLDKVKEYIRNHNESKSN